MTVTSRPGARTGSAADVSALAAVLGEKCYAVLGHTFGAFVALQHAVDAPGAAVATIVFSGVPSGRRLELVDQNLAAFEPAGLRHGCGSSPLDCELSRQHIQ
jgi:proline iminopeptidase